MLWIHKIWKVEKYKQNGVVLGVVLGLVFDVVAIYFQPTKIPQRNLPRQEPSRRRETMTRIPRPQLPRSDLPRPELPRPDAPQPEIIRQADRSLDEGIEVDNIQNVPLQNIPLADIDQFEIDDLVLPPNPDLEGEFIYPKKTPYGTGHTATCRQTRKTSFLTLLFRS